MQIVAAGELALEGDGLLGQRDGERFEMPPGGAREKKREGGKGSDVTHLRVPLVMIKRHRAEDAGEGHGIDLLTAAYAGVHVTHVATKAIVIATRAAMTLALPLRPPGKWVGGRWLVVDDHEVVVDLHEAVVGDRQTVPI